MSLAHLPRRPSTDRTPDDDTRDDIARIAAALEKIARILDEFAGSYLNARFVGNGSDRWARRQ